MNANIKHCGVVDDITGGCIKVRIVQASACASCKVANRCNASESKEKIVEVYDEDTTRFSIGDNVVVSASQGTGFLAVFLSSVIPLFLLIVVLASVLAATGNEAWAALASLGALAPYYLVLYMFKDKIRSRLSFKIEHE